MKKLTKEELRKLQLIQLEILIEFDKICKKHNLKYSLAGGTLIGAIRHKGFIPWDDDIDVTMPRIDYNKFTEIQKKELNKDKYYFQNMDTDDDYVMLSAKIRRKNSIYSESLNNMNKEKQGIWIDIFPMDNTSNNLFIAKINYLRILILKIGLSYKCNNECYSPVLYKKIILNIIKLFSKVHSIKYYKNKLKKLSEKYNNKISKYVVSNAGVYLFKEIIESKYFDSLTSVEFEGYKFNAPKDYDNYLKHYYNDYMKLPPKDKQVSNHFISEIKFPNEKEK